MVPGHELNESSRRNKIEVTIVFIMVLRDLLILFGQVMTEIIHKLVEPER